LREQLSALSRELRDQRSVELIVVDNNSRDGTRDIVRSWSGYPVKLLYARTRSSAAYARNVGAAAAQGEIILFCDADDVVGRGWLAAMMDASKRFDMFGGDIDVERLEPFPNQQSGLALPNDLDFRPWFIGANIGMRKDVWARLGGWNEHYKAAEEIDLCWRAQAYGYSLGLAEDATVHYRSRSSPLEAARQGFAWGIAAPRLLVDHRRHGFRPRSWRYVWRDWARLIRNANHLARDRRQRRDWMRLAGLLFGRIVGSIRYINRLL
jgi:glycosyltransferase involved in cell wall biosynthesis